MMPLVGSVASAPPREPEPRAEPERRDAPAGTWQAWQAERLRQAAALGPAPLARRHEAAPDGRRPAPERARDKDAGAERAAACQDNDAPAPPMPPARQGQGGGQGQGRDSAGGVVQVHDGSGLDAAEELDAELLAGSIAAGAPGQELFELLLPGGQRLGVLLAAHDGRALGVFLSTGDDGLRRQLEARRMELERGLARRMQQATRVTVL